MAKKSESITIRSSKETKIKLESLSKAYHLSQGELIERLIDEELFKNNLFFKMEKTEKVKRLLR